MVNGQFIEGSERTVKWESVDEDTFADFWQYVYTQDYEPRPRPSVASTKVNSDQEKSGTGDDEDQFGGWNCCTKSNKSGTKISCRNGKVYNLKGTSHQRRDDLWQQFKGFQSLHRGVDWALMMKNPAREATRTHDFHCHARLYVFADCYGIVLLMDLALAKLHRDLVGLKLCEETVVDVVELISYCYEELTPDRLRELVALYTACNFEELWDSMRLQQLFGTHGELSTAVMAYLLRRLD